MTPSQKRRWIAVAALYTCLVSAFVLAAALSHGAKAPVWRFVAIAVAAHVPFAGILLLSRRLSVSPFLALGAAAVLRLALTMGEPVFSDDVYRYVWDGRIVSAGLDPYAHPPSADALVGFRDRGYENINNKDLRTIYPPLAELAFGLVASVSPTVGAFQVVMALADLGVVALLMSLVRLGEKKDANAFAAVGLAYGLNPLACIESAMSAHLEPLAVLFVAVATACLAAHRSARISSLAARAGAAAALALSCCLKLVPLLFIAPFARHLRAFAVAVPLALVGSYAVFWSSDLGPVRTLDTFARRWEGNASGFALLEGAARTAIGAAAGVARSDEMVHVPLLDGPARALQGTFFSLHKDGGFDPARPGAFALSDLSRAVAKGIACILLAAIVVWTCRRRLEPTAALLWTGGALVLLTPVMHPWYSLWVLPWAACRDSLPWLALGAVLPLAYLPLDGWWARGVWEAPTWIPAVEYAVFAMAAIGWGVRRKSAPRRERGPC